MSCEFQGNTITRNVFKLLTHFIVGVATRYGMDDLLYRGADKSLAQPGRKQANVSVRMT